MVPSWHFPGFHQSVALNFHLDKKNLQETIVLLLLLAKYTNFSGFV